MNQPPQSLILPSLQPRSREKTRRIIAAGLALLETQPFSDLTVEQIAAEAGCSVGTVYKRFANKEAVLEVLADTVRQEFLRDAEEGLMRDIAAAASLRDLLAALVTRFVGLSRRREGLIRALLQRQLSNPGPGPLMRAVAQVIDLAVSRAQRHRPDAVSPEDFERRFRIAMQMTIALLIHCVLSPAGPLRLGDEQLVPELLDGLLRQITAA